MATEEYHLSSKLRYDTHMHYPANSIRSIVIDDYRKYYSKKKSFCDRSSNKLT